MSMESKNKSPLNGFSIPSMRSTKTIKKKNV